MSVQQTGVSMPGGGRRVQGVVVPDAVTEAIGADVIAAVVEARDPGLAHTLRQLEQLAVGGSMQAAASLPVGKIRSLAVKQGTANLANLGSEAGLEDVATEVTVTASNAKAVGVLHAILRLGIDAYLGEEVSTCRHCDEPVLHRATGDGSDVAWFHRDTGRMLCGDGVNVATKRRRPKRE